MLARNKNLIHLSFGLHSTTESGKKIVGLYNDGCLVATISTSSSITLTNGKIVSDWEDAQDEGDKIYFMNNNVGAGIFFHQNGTISAEPGKDASVADIRIDVSFTENYAKSFVNGYQSWNLSKFVREDNWKRPKSIGSRLNFAYMFKDTDHPVWRMKETGIDSFDVLVLSTNSKDVEKTFLMGANTCCMGQTAFWCRHSSNKNKVTCIIDFGQTSTKKGPVQESFCFLYSESQGAAELMLEEYAKSLKENQIKRDKKSPLSQRERACVGFGSWYQFYENVTSADMDGIIDVISTKDDIKNLVSVIQLDDGFQLNTGDWLETRKSFGEENLSNVAKKISSKGYTPGLWIAPFLCSKTSNVFREHPNWFLRDAKNPKKYVVGHFNPAWFRGSKYNAGDWKSMTMYILDGSHPEVLEHLANLFSELSKHWKFFKIDFLAAGMREGLRYDQSKTRVESYIQGMNAIRDGIGEESFLLGCGAPMLASAQSGVLDSMRVTCDTVESWKAPWIFRKVVYDWDNLPSCETCLRGNITRSFMHGNFWKFNDPDCLVLRKNGSSMTENEVITQCTVLGMTGGLLLFTDDMTKLESDRLELGLKVLPASSVMGKPTNLMESTLPEEYLMEGLTHNVCALLNWGTSKVSVISTDALEFWTGKRLKRGSKWQHKKHQVCALQYPKDADNFLLGTTLNLTALADGRIKTEQNGEICTVSGNSLLGSKTGKLVFTRDVEMVRHNGVHIVLKPNTASHEIELEVIAESWSVEVKEKDTK